MSRFLTPSKMAERLEDKVELDREMTGRFTNELFEIIIRELKKEETFSLFGFGSFKKVYVAPAKGRNPHTGEAIYVPAHYRIKFTAAGKLAERINAEYAHLKPVLLDEEVIHEGLLLKAERYIMTAAAEPEPEGAEQEDPTVPIIEMNTAPEEGQTQDTSAQEAPAEESEAPAVSVVEETFIPEPSAEDTTKEETDSREPIEEHHVPDFGFKKDNRNRVVKLTLLTLLALLIVLGLGWLIFRNIGTPSGTEIIVTEEKAPAPSETAEPESTAPEPESLQGSETAEESPEPVQESATTAEAVPAGPETNYSISPGDSFSLLAQESWGNIYLWPYLYSRNSSSFPDPDLVRPGDEIVIPPQPDQTRDQIRIEDSILFAYQRYRTLIAEQSDNPRNPRRTLSAGYVLLGGERMYPSFLERRQSEIRIEDIRRVEDLNR
ncbi:MAG: HU family DNA-binding protein [Spirochaetales bacterium]|nr:HU family DNA-binding protein [Spirochaetales bacterium]